MPKMKNTFTLVLILLLLPSNLVMASTPTPKSAKPKCRLEVQNAHLSETLQKHRNLLAVKVNVASICDVEQSEVLITLEIHKRGEFGDHVYGPFINDQSPDKNSGLVVKLQDKYVICLNRTSTDWFGIAYSKALIAGKWQYAHAVQSSQIEPLKCGT